MLEWICLNREIPPVPPVLQDIMNVPWTAVTLPNKRDSLKWPAITWLISDPAKQYIQYATCLFRIRTIFVMNNTKIIPIPHLILAYIPKLWDLLSTGVKTIQNRRAPAVIARYPLFSTFFVNSLFSYKIFSRLISIMRWP